MVRLAFSTNAYTRFTLTDAVRRIADHGYDGVELLADSPHAFLPEFDEDDRTRLQETIETTGLSVSNVNANTAMGYYDDAPDTSFFAPTIISDSETERSRRVTYTKRAIDLAGAVGAPAVCVATGRPEPGNPPEQAREQLMNSLHDILDHADSVGVDVGIEFEPELLIECTEEVLELLDVVNRDALGVNLDVGHAAVYGEDPAESIRQCAGHITGVHIEDIVGGRRGKHYHRIPGDGDLNFEAIFRALDDIGYDGFATLELYTYPDAPDRAARRALDALERYTA
ncbi:sugar phosphate isomerase/epimerase family protein [Halocatena salina]|uniref:Sugar phosphate isomerase/epimerase n=1 Tax=Halocatena salina TaxID=2934340 RepID=A0A8U0A5F6_9EURY|nr:sugar phosphate isomerase/epimerase family protein [Halocatena salina]UPM44312.1 sugar phosphate isomerase/epimerase [Halocatena salina]